MAAPSNSVVTSATAAWWSMKPSCEYQKCPERKLNTTPVSSAGPKPNCLRANA